MLWTMVYNKMSRLKNAGDKSIGEVWLKIFVTYIGYDTAAEERIDRLINYSYKRHNFVKINNLCSCFDVKSVYELFKADFHSEK